MSRKPADLLLAAAGVVCLGGALPAPAQTMTPGDFLGGHAVPAESGKPVILEPPPFRIERGATLSAPSHECTSPACRLRIIGEIRRNGAVELRGTALKW